MSAPAKSRIVVNCHTHQAPLISIEGDGYQINSHVHVNPLNVLDVRSAQSFPLAIECSCIRSVTSNYTTRSGLNNTETLFAEVFYRNFVLFNESDEIYNSDESLSFTDFLSALLRFPSDSKNTFQTGGVIRLARSYRGHEQITSKHCEGIKELLDNGCPSTQSAVLIALSKLTTTRNNVEYVFSHYFNLLEYVLSLASDSSTPEVQISALAVVEQIVYFMEFIKTWEQQLKDIIYPIMQGILANWKSKDVQKLCCLRVMRNMSQHSVFTVKVMQDVLTQLTSLNNSYNIKELCLEILHECLQCTQEAISTDVLSKDLLPAVTFILAKGPCTSQYQSLKLLICITGDDVSKASILTCRQTVAFCILCLKYSQCRKVQTCSCQVLQKIIHSIDFPEAKKFMKCVSEAILLEGIESGYLKVMKQNSRIKSPELKRGQAKTQLWCQFDNFIDQLVSQLGKEGCISLEAKSPAARCDPSLVGSIDRDQLSSVLSLVECFINLCMWPLHRPKKSRGCLEHLETCVAISSLRLKLCSLNHHHAMAVWEKVGVQMMALFRQVTKQIVTSPAAKATKQGLPSTSTVMLGRNLSRVAAETLEGDLSLPITGSLDGDLLSTTTEALNEDFLSEKTESLMGDLSPTNTEALMGDLSPTNTEALMGGLSPTNTEALMGGLSSTKLEALIGGLSPTKLEALMGGLSPTNTETLMGDLSLTKPEALIRGLSPKNTEALSEDFSRATTAVKNKRCPLATDDRCLSATSSESLMSHSFREHTAGSRPALNETVSKHSATLEDTVHPLGCLYQEETTLIKALVKFVFIMSIVSCQWKKPPTESCDKVQSTNHCTRIQVKQAFAQKKMAAERRALRHSLMKEDIYSLLAQLADLEDDDIKTMSFTILQLYLQPLDEEIVTGSSHRVNSAKTVHSQYPKLSDRKSSMDVKNPEVYKKRGSSIPCIPSRPGSELNNQKKMLDGTESTSTDRLVPRPPSRKLFTPLILNSVKKTILPRSADADIQCTRLQSSPSHTGHSRDKMVIKHSLDFQSLSTNSCLTSDSLIVSEANKVLSSVLIPQDSLADAVSQDVLNSPRDLAHSHCSSFSERTLLESGKTALNGIFSSNIHVKKSSLQFLHDLVQHSQKEVHMELSKLGCIPKLVDFLRINDEDDFLIITGLTITRMLVSSDRRICQLFNIHGGSSLLMALLQRRTSEDLKLAISSTLSTVTSVMRSHPSGTSEETHEAADIWGHIMQRWQGEDKVVKILTQFM